MKKIFKMGNHAHLTKMKAKSLTFFILLIVVCPFSHGQKIQESINGKTIKTVQLFRTGWELSEPVILLGSDEQLTLSFDELSDEPQPYHYSIVHLTPNDDTSPLVQHDYVTGYPHTSIDDYSFSFNTTYSYIHYKATFPNRDMTILRSGKYALLVYLNFDSDNPVIVRHFWVTEQLVTIAPAIRIPTSGLHKESHQQLNVSIRHPNLPIKNPIQETTLVVRQNGRRDLVKSNLKPDFIRSGEIAYDYQDAMLFEGGNEFRRLDIRSTVFIAENVQKVLFAAPYYHVALKPDDIKWRKPYFRLDDSNGQFVVNVREYDVPEINADYVFVHFTLPMEAPLLRGDMHVYGGLTNWTMDTHNKMIYNFETHAYELTLLLKQGFYNYHYVFLSQGQTKADLYTTEGNHMQTENDYHLYYYYRGIADNYDRLVGYTIINSVKGTR